MICSICYEVKQKSEFQKNGSQCRSCSRERSWFKRKEIEQDDEGKVLYEQWVNQREHVRNLKKDPIIYRKYLAQKSRERLYGLTEAEIYSRGDYQNWLCSICQNDIRIRFYVDHDHSDDKFRGLLCMHCNFGLGHFKDSTFLLERAISYLNE